ncbi:MAG: hypothetical protein ACI83N_001384 [Hydrogenophaga sp.]|jgi:hypothetical protein
MNSDLLGWRLLPWQGVGSARSQDAQIDAFAQQL